MEDKQILQLLWERSEKAITALSSQFGRRLHQLAMNILSVPEDAEEAVNDTYLAVWDAIPPAKPEPLCAYVYKIGRNTALKKLRHRSAQKRQGGYELCLEELSEVLPGPDLQQTLDSRALGKLIDAFLAKLDTESRRLFLRRYWYGDSVRSLSRELGLSENVISVRLHRIRKKLKEHLEQEGFWNEA